VIEELQASNISLTRFPGPHFREGTSKHQVHYNATVTVKIEDRHQGQHKKYISSKRI
jgi:hypothetical protein